MANRMKEEEKNEKIIRGLLKLPSNKRCINCNSLGPQYVCTNFWTFICTNCSGLHREFTHRVKSISMAKFTSQEVSALQEGGNERAREIFFKEWDAQRHSYPDSSHLDRLRDFIKHAYVERRYAGGKNNEGPPRLKGEREDYDDNRSSNTDRSGSRSPPYNDPYEHRYGERPGSAGRNDDRNPRSSYETRSPSYDQGDYRSSSHFETKDEIRQDDKAGNEVQSPKSFEDRISNGLPEPGVSDHQKGAYISSPPMVRPVRDILGGDVPLRVGEPPKMNVGKAPNSPLEKLGSASSGTVPNDGNSLELKRVNSGNLIDFSADPEPPAMSVAQESFSASTPANSGGWASFDVSSQQKVLEVASASGDLESVLAQLSVHSSTSVVNTAISPVASNESFPMANNNGQWPAVQQQASTFPIASSQPTDSLVHTVVDNLNNQVTAQLAGPLFPATLHGSVAVLDGQTSRPVMNPSQRPGYFQNPSEAKNGGRKELPADLFTGLYPTSLVSYPGWRFGPRHGMIYQAQYPVMMGAAQQPVTTFHNSSYSMNPFDLANESAPATNPMLNPSASLQRALPDMSNPLSLPNSSKLAYVPSQWIPQQTSYPSSASPGPYMTQQFTHDMPHQHPSSFFHSMNQGAGVASEPTPYGVTTSNQLPAQANSHLGSLNSSVPSVGGNPFG